MPSGDLEVSVEFLAVRGPSSSSTSVGAGVDAPGDPMETDVAVVARVTSAGSGKGPVSGVRLESAVPKYMRQTLGAPSGTDIGGVTSAKEVRLPLILVNPKRGQGKGLQLRLRVHWTQGGVSRSETVAVQGLPGDL